MNDIGINNLGIVLKNQITKECESPLILDFGEIQDDYSLKTNTFPIPIPVSDYLVCRSLTIGKKGGIIAVSDKYNHSHVVNTGEHEHLFNCPTAGSVTIEGGEHEHNVSVDEHNHQVFISSKMCTVKPYDRVLVAWVGNDAVVIDIIFKAEVIIENE